MVRILKVSPLSPDERLIEEAANVMRNGGLVAFPTETVYGLGADATNEEAVRKIFDVKRRPVDNPLIVHISDMRMLNSIASCDDMALKLAERFWPGPMTMVLKRKNLPDLVSAGRQTVAVRMPAHPIARMLIQKLSRPVAAPSANIAGRPSPTRAEHVLEDLGDKIEMIIDGGEVTFGLESTVVSLVSRPPVLLRPGVITPEQIMEITERLEVPDTSKGLSEYEGRALSPGMKYRHYAPRAKMYVIEGDVSKVVEYIAEEAKKDIQLGMKVGILATEENKSRYPSNAYVLVCGSRSNPYSIALNLFSSLREMDKQKVNIIYSEGFPEHGLFLAISNRLRKASGYNVVRV
jgi:L-threonylcarbamoyladenylate synthase